MKNVITVFFLFVYIIYSYSQQLTEQEYNVLSDLFATDVQLMDTTIDTYVNTKLKSGLSYSHSTIYKLPKNTSIVGRIDKILIIVNSSIYSQVENKIKRYGYDVNYVYGCEVVMEQVSGSDHKDIKNLILSESTGLDGVVLIGNIPAGWYEVANDFDKYGHKEWPCDLYYMDINGTWGDSDSDGIFDSHTGNVQPEIFVGRISTANMGTLLSEKTGLEDYLDKNHKFWIGQLPVNKKYGLSYIDSDWDDIGYFKTDMQHIYGHTNYDAILYKDFTSFGKTDFLNRLNTNRYEFIQLACHSSYAHHAMSGGSIYANEIFNNGTEAIGYNLFCCSACRWTSVSPTSIRGFLGGAYIYNNNNSGLVVVGSTKTGSMLYFNQFYDPLGDGDSFGGALVEWWINACGTSHSNTEIYWHYGLSIIGDPMVNFYHCMNERCNSQIILNSFDNSNLSPIRYFLAKDNITIDTDSNYLIPTGKHVILNAPIVDIIQNFECDLGGTFEIINEGCKSNCP
jgi:hypothetical protein